METKSFLRSLLHGYGGFDRSLPKIEVLKNNPDLGQFRKDVLASGRSIDTLESNTNLESCYKKGWLQAELVPLDENGDESRRVYVFPSKIHEK
jgi:hypothetical protein